MSVSVTITVKVYHCTIGDGLFDGQVGLGTHSVSKGKFDDDCNGDGTYKRTLTFTHSHTETGARIDGVAFEPESRLLYYTDMGRNRIGVTTPSGSYHKVILASNLTQIRAIELDPDNG